MINRSILLRRTRMVLLLSILLILAPTLFAETAPPAPQIPSVFARSQRLPSKPMPLGLKITIAAVVLAVAAISLAFLVRAWRSSNLFDREYRFPVAANVALRLGANKSGGCLAAVAFGDHDDLKSNDSTAENS